MPAVNRGISVSRVGGDAQIKAMKKVAGTLKLILFSVPELQSSHRLVLIWMLTQRHVWNRGARIVEVLKQNQECNLFL